MRPLAALAIAMLLLAIYAPQQAQASEPPIPGLAYVKHGNTLFLPNESLHAVIPMSHEPGVALVTLNTSMGKVWVHLVYASENGTRSVGPAVVEAESVIYATYDPSVAGVPAVILLARSGGPENDSVVVIDARNGSILMEERVSSIFNASTRPPTTLLLEAAYCLGQDTLLIRTVSAEIVLSAVNVASPQSSWVYEPPGPTAASAIGVHNGTAYLYTVSHAEANGTGVYAYNVTLIDVATGEIRGERTILVAPESEYYSLAARGHYAVLYRATDHGLRILAYDAAEDDTGQINVTTGATNVLGLSWSPAGRMAALVSASQAGEHEIRVLNLHNASTVYEFTGSYIDPGEIRWSPGEDAIAFHEAQPLPGGTLHVVDLTRGAEVLAVNVSIIYALSWGMDGRFFLVKAYPGGYPRLYSYTPSPAGVLEQEQVSTVFHPGRVSEIVVLSTGSSESVFYVDHLAYDPAHGYWDRIYLYKLEPAPVKRVYESSSLIIGVANPAHNNASGGMTVDDYLGSGVMARGYIGYRVHAGYIVILRYTGTGWDRHDTYGLLVELGSIELYLEGRADAVYWINFTSPTGKTPVIVVPGDTSGATISTSRGLLSVQIRFGADGATSVYIPGGTMFYYEFEYEDPGADALSVPGALPYRIHEVLEVTPRGVLLSVPPAQETTTTTTTQVHSRPGTTSSPVQSPSQSKSETAPPQGEPDKGLSWELAIGAVIVLAVVAALAARARR